MRAIILGFACISALVSCTDKVETKETTTSDSVSVATPVTPKPAEVQSGPLTPIDSIKQEVARINMANLPSKRHDFMCDEKSYVVYHYDDKAIVKAKIDWGTVGDAYHREEFYYRNGKLIFEYDLLEGAGAYEGGDKKLERRSYIVNDKVEKYLENDKQTSCKDCSYSKSSIAYKALTAEKSKDYQAILCR